MMTKCVGGFCGGLCAGRGVLGKKWVPWCRNLAAVVGTLSECVGCLLFGGVGEGFVLELHASGGVGVGVIDGIPQEALLSGDQVCGRVWWRVVCCERCVGEEMGSLVQESGCCGGNIVGVCGL